MGYAIHQYKRSMKLQQTSDTKLTQWPCSNGSHTPTHTHTHSGVNRTCSVSRNSLTPVIQLCCSSVSARWCCCTWVEVFDEFTSVVISWLKSNADVMWLSVMQTDGCVVGQTDEGWQCDSDLDIQPRPRQYTDMHFNANMLEYQPDEMLHPETYQYIINDSFIYNLSAPECHFIYIYDSYILFQILYTKVWCIHSIH